jgi:magnesium-transporting ATPase (P-type)
LPRRQPFRNPPVSALILTAPGLSVINSAIDEARRIFGRITSYTIYRVALTMDIMFLVVLATIFLGFKPLTAVMIVIISLLDDVPNDFVFAPHWRRPVSFCGGPP